MKEIKLIVPDDEVQLFINLCGTGIHKDGIANMFSFCFNAMDVKRVDVVRSEISKGKYMYKIAQVFNDGTITYPT